MSRPRRIPCRGDGEAALVAELPTTANVEAVSGKHLNRSDRRPVLNAPRANGPAADRVSHCDTVAPSKGHDLRVNAKAKAHSFSKLYSCLGHPDVQIVTANALLVARTFWLSEIATRASG
jgi:hypothetical protein